MKWYKDMAFVKPNEDSHLHPICRVRDKAVKCCNLLHKSALLLCKFDNFLLLTATQNWNLQHFCYTCFPPYGVPCPMVLKGQLNPYTHLFKTIGAMKMYKRTQTHYIWLILLTSLWRSPLNRRFPANLMACSSVIPLNISTGSWGHKYIKTETILPISVCQYWCSNVST